MSKDKPRLELTCRLVEVGLDEEFDSSVLRLTVNGAPTPVVTIPVSQKIVKDFAPGLYEKVKLTLELL